MGHQVSLFIGPMTALRVLAALSPLARTFELAPRGRFLALPLTEAVHDDMHVGAGTGDWLERGAMLTSTDLAQAARASRATSLAYVETDYFGGVGRQNALLWRDGTLVLRPAELWIGKEAAVARPRSLWPINATLRGLGVVATEGYDEFDTIGLGAWRSNEAIVAGAREVSVGA